MSSPDKPQSFLDLIYKSFKSIKGHAVGAIGLLLSLLAWYQISPDSKIEVRIAVIVLFFLFLLLLVLFEASREAFLWSRKYLPKVMIAREIGEEDKRELILVLATRGVGPHILRF